MYAVKRTERELAWERGYSQTAVQTDSIASFTIETGGQRPGHVMWILTNQQAAW